MQRREALLGIGFMLASFFCFGAADVLTKLLTQAYHPLQVTFIRQTGLLVLALILVLRFGPAILRSRSPGWQVTRGLTSVITGATYVTALAYVPLADATAVTFLAPLFVVVLAAVVLGERLDLPRALAVTVGLVGTLVIIRPGAGVFHPAMTLVVVCAVFFAVRQILSRWLTGRDSLRTTIVWSGLVTSLVLALPQPWVWTAPADAAAAMMMLALAIIVLLGELALIRSLELAQAGIAAPSQYTLLIWATLWGWLVFGQLPDFWTLVGAAIIIASGMFTLWHETRSR